MVEPCTSNVENNNGLFDDLHNKNRHNQIREHLYELDTEEDESFVPATSFKTFNSISNDDDILQMYLKDVGRVKLLSFQEPPSK